jgi:hypothetical protein
LGWRRRKGPATTAPAFFQTAGKEEIGENDERETGLKREREEGRK